MDEVFKISKDRVRAGSLFEMAQERLNDIISIIPKDKVYKIVEEYYEVVVQLVTALMYLDGYKTLSHVKLIDYLSKNYKDFGLVEIKLIDSLRKFRHGAVYYGKKIKEEFLINNEDEIKSIIDKLVNILKERLKE